jgi:hypothetical protein
MDIVNTIDLCRVGVIKRIENYSFNSLRQGC